MVKATLFLACLCRIASCGVPTALPPWEAGDLPIHPNSYALTFHNSSSLNLTMSQALPLLLSVVMEVLDYFVSGARTANAAHAQAAAKRGGLRCRDVMFHLSRGDESVRRYGANVASGSGRAFQAVRRVREAARAELIAA